MSTDQHATTRRRDDALRDALAASRGTAHPDGTPIPTAPVLHALAQWLAQEIPATINDVQRARLRTLERLCTDAALYGYPRPPLEQLGAQAGHLPASRSSDPATARESGERTRLTPSARNHLGRLLVGFLMYEHQEVRRVRDAMGPDADMTDDDVDASLTSEEVAHRVGLGGSEFAKRCSDLLALGFIRVAQDAHGHDRTRQGDSGRQRLVFELTDDGRVMASRISWADEHDRA